MSHGLLTRFNWNKAIEIGIISLFVDTKRETITPVSIALDID